MISVRRRPSPEKFLDCAWALGKRVQVKIMLDCAYCPVRTND